MDNTLLKTVYSSEAFRKKGHELVDLLAHHLHETLNGKAEKTIHWNDPTSELNFWRDFLENGSDDSLFSEITKRTTHVHHPKYVGHQVAPTAPITALTGMISSLLNNGMAVYEMGMSPSTIEIVVTDFLCKKIGYSKSANGFLTSGGTLANLTALLCARKVMLDHDVWKEGHKQDLGIMVSEEAHYCIDRAARIMGLGEKGIIKIPSTSKFQMDTALLEQKFVEAKENGIHVFAIVGSAPSTATGAYDDLEAIAHFAKRNNLWFHADGAHGGAAIFSKKYRYTVKGIDLADSVVIDGHKMMMMPTITTALLFKDGRHKGATFSQKADYLLAQDDHEDWYNSGKNTFECTKNMMSIHWFTMLKIYGESVFDEYVTKLYELGHRFGQLIQADPDFELAMEPMTNIVCFRYVDSALSTSTLNDLNKKIRQEILEEGEFYIVQTTLRRIHYLRTTLMNSFTTQEHLATLLAKIKKFALQIKNF